jgi:quercetin dioxygenase-like cupin family protein
MPFISAQQSQIFNMIPGVTFTGLAAPSRGSQENSVWLVSIAPNTSGMPHRLNREEILVGLEGVATATLNGVDYQLTVGAAIVVPPDTEFALANPNGATFRAVAVLPAAGQAYIAGEAPFTPLWAA